MVGNPAHSAWTRMMCSYSLVLALVDQMMQFNAADDDYNNLELVPPPLFTRLEFPFDYRYDLNNMCH
jgi:hypothetical protein